FIRVEREAGRVSPGRAAVLAEHVLLAHSRKTFFSKIEELRLFRRKFEFVKPIRGGQVNATQLLSRQVLRGRLDVGDVTVRVARNNDAVVGKVDTLSFCESRFVVVDADD